MDKDLLHGLLGLNLSRATTLHILGTALSPAQLVAAVQRKKSLCAFNLHTTYAFLPLDGRLTQGKEILRVSGQ